MDRVHISVEKRWANIIQVVASSFTKVGSSLFFYFVAYPPLKFSQNKVYA